MFYVPHRGRSVSGAAAVPLRQLLPQRFGYVRSIVRDDHEAEDVTQHVFTKLMTTLVKYDDRGLPFFAWLLRLARNVAIDHLRGESPYPDGERARSARILRHRHGSGGDGQGSSRHASGGAAASRVHAPRRWSYARRDRRSHRAQQKLHSRPASPRPTGAPARAGATRFRSIHACDASARGGVSQAPGPCEITHGCVPSQSAEASPPRPRPPSVSAITRGEG